MGYFLQMIKKPIIVSVVITALYLLLTGLPITTIKLLDGLSLSAILLLIIGLSRIVGCLGLFTRTGYGISKLLEVIKTKNYSKGTSTYPTLEEYKKERTTPSPALPYLLVSAVEILICFVLIS